MLLSSTWPQQKGSEGGTTIVVHPEGASWTHCTALMAVQHAQDFSDEHMLCLHWHSSQQRFSWAEMSFLQCNSQKELRSPPSATQACPLIPNQST